MNFIGFYFGLFDLVSLMFYLNELRRSRELLCLYSRFRRYFNICLSFHSYYLTFSLQCTPKVVSKAKYTLGWNSVFLF